jgi:hypothetical protein
LAGLQERRVGVEQLRDALTRQQLAAGRVPGTRHLASAERRFVRLCAQVVHEGSHGPGFELGRPRVGV